MIPILIGGTGRSGTTILKRVLSNHSAVVALPMELRVIVDPGGALDLISALSNRWSPYNADAAIHRFRTLMLSGASANSVWAIFFQKVEKRILNFLRISPRYYAGLGLAYHFRAKDYRQRVNNLIVGLTYHISSGSWSGSPAYQIRGRLYEADPFQREALEKIFATFFHDLYTDLSLTLRKNSSHWLDDTPYNLLHADELVRLFPEMKLIHIFRDPRDVIASYRTFSWGGDDFASIARRLAGIYARWLEIRDHLPRDSYLEISLEKLASDPQSELATICKFLGLNFEEALLQIPFNKVHANRWRREIPQDEIKKALPFLQRYLEVYEYAPE